MILEEIKDTTKLESAKEMLQSPLWAHIQKGMGQEVFYLSEEGRALLVMKKSLSKLGSYFYSPRGPEQYFSGLGDYARKAGVVFWRLEPGDNEILDKFKQSGLKLRKTINLQPQQTLILNLSQSEEELLAQMKQKTRYNINLAQKKGVQIREVSLEELNLFWQLMATTGERDSFRTHNRNYYYNLLKYGQGKIKLYVAEEGGDVLATAMIGEYGDFVTYLHGGSSDLKRNFMAPQLLQWEIIKKAKQASFKYYDFFGIDAEKWPGVTRFKLGFGGEVKDYPGTYDIIFQPMKYFIYNILRKIKRKF